MNYKDYISLTNISEEFNIMYQTLYNKHISSLEKMRKKCKKSIFIGVPCITLTTIVLILASLYIPTLFAEHEMFENMTNLGIAMLMVTIIMIVVVPIAINIREYKKTYKKEIISNFVKLVNPHLNYNDISRLTETDYVSANFDILSFNHFELDDYIEGNINKEIYIQMSDVLINGENRFNALFRGIFATIKCKKNIGEYVKISTNQLKSVNSASKVQMDSNEFEKYFDVYSEDKILATRLLTSDIMELLLEFYKKYYLKFEIVFKNENIYLRFFTGAMFEPKIFKEAMHKKSIFVYYTVLKFVLELSEKANKILDDIEI